MSTTNAAAVLLLIGDALTSGVGDLAEKEEPRSRILVSAVEWRAGGWRPIDDARTRPVAKKGREASSSTAI